VIFESVFLSNTNARLFSSTLNTPTCTLPMSMSMSCRLLLLASRWQSSIRQSLPNVNKSQIMNGLALYRIIDVHSFGECIVMRGCIKCYLLLIQYGCTV
jgi:hypothetical protein